jgi:1-acyl-sn-glycerol-3-phosphate acyltransferase
VYWIVRAVLQPFFLVYFRMQRLGREQVPESGPVIIAANHRSFLDPFVIGMMTRRPVYYVAKRELFANRLVGWFLSSLGAFPVHRGTGDQDMLATARAILNRGGVVLIFPEGTRTRPGPLGRPRRGVGRLALETGAAVVPVAIAGTEGVRRGWRIRPRRVRVSAARPRRFKPIANPSPQLAAALTERVWADVQVQFAALQRPRRLPAVGKRRPSAA